MARREQLGFGLHPMFESAAHGPSLLFPDSISAPLDLFMHLFGFRFSDPFHHKIVVEKLFSGGPGLYTTNPGLLAPAKLNRPEDWRSSESSSTRLLDAHVGTAPTDREPSRFAALGQAQKDRVFAVRLSGPTCCGRGPSAVRSVSDREPSRFAAGSLARSR